MSSRQMRFLVVATATAVVFLASAAVVSWALPAGQSFVVSNGVTELGVPASTMSLGNAAAGDSPDSGMFDEGTRAINGSRWADAVRIFANAAAQHGEHAAGALYWKAYAEDKLGKSKDSEETCSQLRASFPKSPWNEDCGALVVEIRSKSGKAIQMDPGASDDVKLLALNAMMRQDQPRALAEMQSILNGDASERLKKEAAFILGEHYSDITYAQIVRIRFVEGDVRIQRGAANGKTDGALWEKAVSDLPLETGFSLVTGEGRAEIEFENASTLYLDENSVLTMNDLHETAGVPYTEIALIAGTVSLHIHPYVAGEKFVLHTATDDLVSKFPDKTYARIQSFIDGIAITPLEGGELRLPGVPHENVQPGRTWTYRLGQLWVDEQEGDDTAFATWDQWVTGRVEQRDKVVAAVMQESGLPAPIPGMAELAGQGKFFECAPFGTCWEPNDQVNAEDNTAHQFQDVAPQREWVHRGEARLLTASFQPLRLPSAALLAEPLASQDATESRYRFPCTPDVLRYRRMKDPVTGKQIVTPTELAQTHPYDWAVCHAGSWIERQNHYTWVASCRRRHIDPVRWVKSGHTIAFVPLHPYDVKGQPPINIKRQVFEVSGKGELAVRPIKLEPDHPIQFLEEPPKEYRAAALRPLARMEAPRMEARALGNIAGNKSVAVNRPEVPLRFDPQSLSFAIPRQETRGGQTATVFAPLTNRSGTLQMHGESLIGGKAGSNNFHSTTNGGVSPGGSRSAPSAASHPTNSSSASSSGSHAPSAASSSPASSHSNSGTNSPH